MLARISLYTFFVIGGLGWWGHPARGAEIFCAGDCDRDGVVSIDELTVGVGQALGSDVRACDAFDTNSNGQSEIDEVVRGVINAIRGCPAQAASPTPTPTSPAMPSDTPNVLDFVQRVEDDVSGVAGLGGVSAMAMSQDGRHLYVAAAGDRAITLFEVDAHSGRLQWIEAIGVDPVETFISPSSLALSPDGGYLYTHGSRRLAIFRRDETTGRLTLASTDGVGGDGGTMLFSPDGLYLYRAQGSQIRVSRRDPATGAVTLIQTFSSVPPASATLATSRNSGGRDAIAMSPEGRYVYGFVNGLVVTLQRDADTGELSHAGSLAIDSTRDAALTISSDGRFAYLVSEREGALYAFSRNTESGALTQQQRWSDRAGLGGAVAVSIDADDELVFAAGSTDGAVGLLSPPRWHHRE